MRVKARKHVRNEGSRQFKSALSANQSADFAYIGEGRNSARNVAFFLPAAHRREPAHARFSEHSLCAK
jgi:hypothetical protein